MKATTMRKFIWLVLSLCGLGFQLFLVFFQYFSYEINTNIRLTIEENIIPPTMTICLETMLLIKWDKISDETRKFIFSTAMSEEESNSNMNISELMSKLAGLSYAERITVNGIIMRNFNVSQIINDLTLDSNEVFEEMGSYSYDPTSNTYLMGAPDKFFSITTYLRDVYICFALDIREEFILGLNYNKLMRQEFMSFLLNTVAIDSSVMVRSNRFFYMLGIRGSPIESGFTRKLTYSIRERGHRGYTYQENVENLLPPPFDTKCRNYSSHGFRGQEDCYETCVREKSLNLTGKLLPSLIFHANETEQVIPFIDVLMQNSVTNGMPLRDDIVDFCENSCRDRSCRIHSFVPKEIFYVTREPESNFKVSNFIRNTPLTVATCMQHFTMIQFLTDVASSLGFWIGFSAVGSLDKIMLFYRIVLAHFISEKERKRKPSSVQKKKETRRHWNRRRVENKMRRQLFNYDYSPSFCPPNDYVPTGSSERNCGGYISIREHMRQ